MDQSTPPIVSGRLGTVLFILGLFLLESCVDAHAERRKRRKIPSCRKKQEIYKFPPVPLQSIINIVPIGNLAPSGHTFPTQHLYLHLKREVEGDYSSAIREVPVVAPARLWVTNIKSFENLTKGRSDFSIDFSPCRQLHGYFIHMNSISERLTRSFNRGEKECREYSAGGEDYRLCYKRVKVKVPAGAALGTKGGFAEAGSLDFGLRDKRKTPIKFANPSRWENMLVPYNVCSLDYYGDELKQSLKEFLRDHSGNPRTIEPRCGTIAHDVSGSAQGNWYLKGSDAGLAEDQHLALVPDNFHPNYLVFSIGNALESSGIRTGTYYFEPGTSGETNRSFSEVTADGKIYCFDTQDQYPTNSQSKANSVPILLKLTSSTELQIGPYGSESCGDGPWDFGTQAVQFER